MCRPIRNLTQARGFDCRKHVLSVFGGAGGQHACSVADALKMDTISLHKYAIILYAIETYFPLFSKIKGCLAKC